jgi:uncharacterized membrane protein (UPF0127 family)
MKNRASSRNVFLIGIAVLLALALFMWPRHVPGFDPGPGDRPHFARGELTVARADGTQIPLKVEIAATPQEEMYGLMFVKNLAPDAGMIFMQPGDYEADFWMKNTLIPLDMLFVRKDGEIVKIVANAKPLDLGIIRSDQPVRAILEINGGEAARRGLKEGDKVLFPGLGAL